MIKVVDGVEVEMTSEEVAAFEAGRAGLDASLPLPDPMLPLSGVAAGLAALGFTQEQIKDFTAAATIG